MRVYSYEKNMDMMIELASNEFLKKILQNDNLNIPCDVDKEEFLRKTLNDNRCSFEVAFEDAIREAISDSFDEFKLDFGQNALNFIQIVYGKNDNHLDEFEFINNPEIVEESLDESYKEIVDELCYAPDKYIIKREFEKYNEAFFNILNRRINDIDILTNDFYEDFLDDTGLLEKEIWKAEI